MSYHVQEQTELTIQGLHSSSLIQTASRRLASNFACNLSSMEVSKNDNFECKKIECYRKIWRKQCLEIEKEFNLQTLFCEPELREDLEKSFVIFFNII